MSFDIERIDLFANECGFGVNGSERSYVMKRKRRRDCDRQRQRQRQKREREGEGKRERENEKGREREEESRIENREERKIAQGSREVYVRVKGADLFFPNFFNARVSVCFITPTLYPC